MVCLCEINKQISKMFTVCTVNDVTGVRCFGEIRVIKCQHNRLISNVLLVHGLLDYIITKIYSISRNIVSNLINEILLSIYF